MRLSPFFFGTINVGDLHSLFDGLIFPMEWRYWSCRSVSSMWRTLCGYSLDLMGVVSTSGLNSIVNGSHGMLPISNSFLDIISSLFFNWFMINCLSSGSWIHLYFLLDIVNIIQYAVISVSSLRLTCSLCSLRIKLFTQQYISSQWINLYHLIYLWKQTN